jgi:hypothetical protein
LLGHRAVFDGSVALGGLDQSFRQFDIDSQDGLLMRWISVVQKGPYRTLLSLSQLAPPSLIQADFDPGWSA